MAAGLLWWTEPTAPRGKSWDLVFRQPDGRPVGHKSDRADWKALLADAGVRNARLHDARRTAASLLLLMKVPARLMAGAVRADHADDQGAPRHGSGD